MSISIPGLQYPVRNIFCIGRNYAAHARELGNAVPETPVVFLKPVSALVPSGGSIELPPRIGRVDHELEVVVAIGRRARNITEQEALASIAGYAIGIDVTARDEQDAAKKKALPWTVAKGHDTFAAIGNFVAAARVGDPQAIAFALKINGKPRQTGNTGNMIFPIARLIAYLSTVFTLDAGDLIFTGTPEGVGPLIVGDKIEATLGEGLATLELDVVTRE